MYEDRPLDHVTARVVTELASALLPRLRETLTDELAKATEALSSRTSRSAEDAMASLWRLKEAAAAIGNDLEALQNSMRKTSDEVLSSLLRLCEQLESSVSRIAERDLMVQESEAIALEMTKALRSVEASIADWEGILKADGRAQTREFSEFSIEVSELAKDIRVALPVIIREAVEETAASHDGEWLRALEAKALTADAKLARLSKIVILEGVAVVVLLAAIAVALFR